jgi:Domain of Unknown Function (DUF1080)
VTRRQGGLVSFILPFCLVLPSLVHGQQLTDWPQHSMDRPRPPVVDPGKFPGSPSVPSDAISLFNGKSLDHWRSSDDAHGPAGWKVAGDYLEVVAGAGGIETVAGFGDAQVHVEWMAPNPPRGEGQDRGNSGIFLMGRYEVQVLDSWRNDTYPDGQAGSVYGQYPPRVNPIRPPGEWNSYDIVFHRPRFDSAGRVVAPARMTVFFNHVLVQDNVELVGPTSHRVRNPYERHADRLPISLQDHGHPVRFRNIWIRELEP